MPALVDKPLSRGLSCMPCRTRKQRCDGAKPECSSCVRTGRQSQCKYTSPPRTKEQRMEDRVAELEVILAQAELQRPVDFIGAQRMPRSSASSAITIPQELSDHLLETFFSFAFQFDFPLSIPKFLQALTLPENDPRRPHPALLNAIHLVGCHWSERDLQSYERVFLERAQHDLEEALARVDRLIDFIVATVLVGRYCLYSGVRHIEAIGTYTATSAVTFAESCGLHRLKFDADATDEYTYYLLPSPEHVLEHMERVNIWWSVYILSRNASLIGGNAVHLDDKNILTPWPRQGLHTVNGKCEPPTRISIREDDTFIGLKAKSSALLHRAARHSVRMMALSNPAQNASFWAQQRAIIDDLNAFRNSVPPLPHASEVATFHVDTNECRNGRTASPTYKAAVKNHAIIYAQTCELGARLQVHGILSDALASEHDLLLEAAHRVAYMVNRLGDFECKLIHPFCAMTWAAARRVLVQEQHMLEKTRAPYATLGPVQSSVGALASAFNRLSSFYPRLQRYREETDMRA